MEFKVGLKKERLLTTSTLLDFACQASFFQPTNSIKRVETVVLFFIVLFAYMVYVRNETDYLLY